MIGKIGGRTAQLFPCGKHIPKCFAESYNVLFHRVSAAFRFN